MKKIIIMLVLSTLLTLPLLCENVSALVLTELTAKFSDIHPTIDGFLGNAEWNDTKKYNITLVGDTDIEAWLYIKHNGTNIHIGLLVWEIYTHATDEFILAFDEGDDGGRGSGSRDYTLIPLQEDLKACYSSYQLRDGYYNGSWYAKADEIDFDANCTHEIDHGPLPSEIEYWEGLGWADDHWECEFSIPFVGNDAGTSDVSDLSCSVTDIVGIKIQYFYTGANFYFPSGDKTQVNTYAYLRFSPPIVESCSGTGEQKDSFNLYEDVHVNGSGFLPNATYDFYVVSDVETWTDGMPIPAREAGTETMITSDADGNVLPVAIWNDPSTEGAYDIVVDVNGNGNYDKDIDALDNDDVEVTAGFVIPELTSLIALLALMLTAFAAFVTSKKRLL